MIKLGLTYRDAISLFQGVAIGHVNYLTGCNQTLLQPPSGDHSKKNEAEWIDDERLFEVAGIEPITLDPPGSGFDRAAPKR